jgi:hypothetical protein
MNKLIETYISLATEHGECTLDGNYKNGNKAYAKLQAVIKDIYNSDKDVRKKFFELLHHENDSVKIWTATTLLKTFENEALKTLKEIELKSDNIFSLTAQTTIDVWHKGELKNIIDWK